MINTPRQHKRDELGDHKREKNFVAHIANPQKAFDTNLS
jgi:hypothetical protein